SVPADGWQPTQSEPTAADMMPMVSRKSSTPMPLSAWTFVNTSSTIFGVAAAVGWPACAAARGAVAAAAASIVTSPAAIAFVGPNVIGPPSLFLRRRPGAATPRPLAELLEAAAQLGVELGAFARIPVAAMAGLARGVEILADIPQLGDVAALHDVER